MKKNLLFVLFFIINNLLNAQKASISKSFDALPDEKLFIHLNNNFLLTGEKLYYKAYCLIDNNKFSDISKVGYIEIIDSENKSVNKQKIVIKNGVGAGDLFINPDLKSGTYKFVAYTKWMTNKNAFFSENIFIINPFDKKLAVSNENYSSTYKKNLTINNSLKLTPKEKFAKREVVSLLLNDHLQGGHYSISVHQKNDSLPEKNTTTSFVTTTNTYTNNDTFELPEVRGSILSGKISSKKENQNLSYINIGLTTVSKSPLTLTTKTDVSGNFNFILEDLNTSKISLQILEKNSENYTISIFPAKQINKEFKDFENINITKKLADRISQRTIFMQIENAYNTTKKDSIIIQPIDYVIKGKKTYYLDDYKRFKTVKETIVEVLDNVFISKKNNKNYVYVRNEGLQNYGEVGTLVIIDGYIIYDHDALFDVDSKDINDISIIRNKYLFGNQLYQGVLIVNTTEKDYKPNPSYHKEFTVLAPEPKKIYFKENYLNNKKENIPDYRTQLYWNPNLKKISEQITFYTSDVIGNYEINIEGFTNNGKPISLKSYFKVE